LDLLLGTVLVRQEDSRIDDIAILILGGSIAIYHGVSEWFRGMEICEALPAVGTTPAGGLCDFSGSCSSSTPRIAALNARRNPIQSLFLRTPLSSANHGVGAALLVPGVAGAGGDPASYLKKFCVRNQLVAARQRDDGRTL